MAKINSTQPMNKNDFSGALQKLHAEDGLRAADASIRVDPQEEIEPAPPLRESEISTSSEDPELRADDESVTDLQRKFRAA